MVARNDSHALTVHHIDDYVRQLAVSYAHLRVTDRKIGEIVFAWEAKDLKRIVRLIAEVYRIPTAHIRVAFGRQTSAVDVPAEISILLPHGPHYLSFRDRAERIFGGGCSLFVHMVAHEMSHVRLIGDNHPLRVSEVATDLLPLVLGFDRPFVEMQDQFRFYRQAGYIPKHLIREVLASIERYGPVIYL